MKGASSSRVSGRYAVATIDKICMHVHVIAVPPITDRLHHSGVKSI